ncbi:MAG: MBL fold metallo-hydrolase [SAR202 cluster bacterium]|nr:MBL fold metallo-hydrolase [SAR202 cluster bacterium]
MPNNVLTVGNVKIISLADTVIPANILDFIPGTKPGDWAKYSKEIDEKGALRKPMNIAAFLVITPRHKVLVDAGIGPVPWPSSPHLKGTLLTKLKRAGFRPDEIDIVFATHVHLDHMGWCAVLDGDKLTRTFSKAKYVVPKTDWDSLFDTRNIVYRRRPKDVSERGVEILLWSKPLAERMAVFGNIEHTTRDGENIIPELKVMDTPGHSPGHQSVLLSSKGERVFFPGDAIHMPPQLDVPGRIVGADVHPKLGAKTRARVAKWMESEGVLVASTHFPAPGFGHVVRGKGRRYWRPLKTK